MHAALSEFTDLVCDHCGMAHVRVEVIYDRCRCGGAGLVACGELMYPCVECPGDGWRALFSGMELDRQVRACAQVNALRPMAVAA